MEWTPAGRKVNTTATDSRFGENAGWTTSTPTLNCYRAAVATMPELFSSKILSWFSEKNKHSWSHTEVSVNRIFAVGKALDLCKLKKCQEHLNNEIFIPQTPHLKNSVRSIWQVEGFTPFPNDNIIPKGVVEIIFNFSGSPHFDAEIGGKQFQLTKCFING
jgi:hypothetical protein